MKKEESKIKDYQAKYREKRRNMAADKELKVAERKKTVKEYQKQYQKLYQEQYRMKAKAKKEEKLLKKKKYQDNYKKIMRGGT